MNRKHDRQLAKDYSIQVLQVNGAVRDELISESISVENISKGGFRFITKCDLGLEDRVQVELKFPDASVKKVLGRISYCEDIESENKAYGFSILEGFYSLVA